jgi:hypothetical protein
MIIIDEDFILSISLEQRVRDSLHCLEPEHYSWWGVHFEFERLLQSLKGQLGKKSTMHVQYYTTH